MPQFRTRPLLLGSVVTSGQVAPAWGVARKRRREERSSPSVLLQEGGGPPLGLRWRAGSPPRSVQVRGGPSVRLEGSSAVRRRSQKRWVGEEAAVWRARIRARRIRPAERQINTSASPLISYFPDMGVKRTALPPVVPGVVTSSSSVVPEVRRRRGVSRAMCSAASLRLLIGILHPLITEKIHEDVRRRLYVLTRRGVLCDITSSLVHAGGLEGSSASRCHDLVTS